MVLYLRYIRASSYNNKEVVIMGKDLKGKPLDKGITQEKSGLYVARYVDRFGKRQSKRFKKINEARRWLANSTYLDKSSNPLFPQDMIVDSWFIYWLNMKKNTLRAGTIDVYTARYNKNIHPAIGSMKLVDVKPFHIQSMLNTMADNGYHNGTIRQVRVITYSLFQDCYENDIILSNPCKSIKKCNIGIPAKIKDALTRSERDKFVSGIKGHKYENQWLLALITGLRVGELINLKWQDVLFEKRCLQVNGTMNYNCSSQKWRYSPGKSSNSRRTIPLTDDAIEILKRQKQKVNQLKVIPMQYKDYVFIDEDGLIKQSTYHASLKWACKKAGIRRITMHQLRHTAITNWINADMPLKTVQLIAGHYCAAFTLDRYVHVTEEDMTREMERVSNMLRII